MALLHRATIVPTKSELVASWLPGRPWAPASPTVAGVAYRFDDPAGEVGMEAFLLRTADGVTCHVPLTYRGSPLAGADAHLLGTMEHSVLGTRWVYDGCHDPVWVATLAATIATGGTEAELIVDAAGARERRDPEVRVRGSGSGGWDGAGVGDLRVVDGADVTTVSCALGEVVVVRRVGVDANCPDTLSATWDAYPSGVAVAGLRDA